MAVYPVKMNQGDRSECMLQNAHRIFPLHVQVHHAVCDGFYLSRFIDTLQSLIETF